MNLPEIRCLARERGLKPGKLSKTALIRSLQRQEGNFDCFATAFTGECDQIDCLWRQDCFTFARKKH